MDRVWPLPDTHLISFEAATRADFVAGAGVALLYSQPAFDAVRDRLPLQPVWQAEVREATEAAWQPLLHVVQGELLLAVGGGLVADAAKYVAAHRGLPLVCLPTALSVDAFLTWASGVRQGGVVRYLVTKPPDHLVLDFDVLAAAPPAIRAAGICDVLSIATGCWDWQFAAEQGRNPPGMDYIPYVYDAAQAILQGALDAAEAAGAGERQGLKQLYDCLALEVQLCNQIGHSRPEEGSEHYFAYAVENEMGKGLPHGELVGPGILLLAALQGQDVRPLRAALQACHIPLDRIPPAVVAKTLRELPAYCRRHRLPFGIAHTLTDEKIAAYLEQENDP